MNKAQRIITEAKTVKDGTSKVVSTTHDQDVILDFFKIINDKAIMKDIEKYHDEYVQSSNPILAILEFTTNFQKASNLSWKIMFNENTGKTIKTKAGAVPKNKISKIVKWYYANRDHMNQDTYKIINGIEIKL